MTKINILKNKNLILGMFFVSFLLIVSGCTKTVEQPPQAPQTPEENKAPLNQVGQIKIEIVNPETCTVNPATFECSTFSVTRSKILINFTNKFNIKTSIVDFRLKSDNAKIYCVGPETKTTVVNTPSGESFTLICDGIPTGRLPFGENEEISFELDYKTSSDNTLRTATGTVNAKVN